MTSVSTGRISTRTSLTVSQTASLFRTYDFQLIGAIPAEFWHPADRKSLRVPHGSSGISGEISYPSSKRPNSGGLRLCEIGVALHCTRPACHPELRSVSRTPPTPSVTRMFMLKKKKPQVDSTKQMKAIAWDLSKIALVFVGIRAASVFLNQEN
ncbi:hypothetical protein GQ600_2299 [Phytophthora cactorum]|nr:hypothetical protein GQ600_2299 [Phytophthora cactorum]